VVIVDEVSPEERCVRQLLGLHGITLHPAELAELVRRYPLARARAGRLHVVAEARYEQPALARADEIASWLS
jgi:hypothetical protein